MVRFEITFDNSDNQLDYPVRFVYANDVLDAINKLTETKYLIEIGYTVNRIRKIERVNENGEGE